MWVSNGEQLEWHRGWGDFSMALGLGQSGYWNESIQWASIKVAGRSTEGFRVFVQGMQCGMRSAEGREKAALTSESPDESTPSGRRGCLGAELAAWESLRTRKRGRLGKGGHGGGWQVGGGGAERTRYYWAGGIAFGPTRPAP
jgi:hypothetical protein